jgi:hypothetical protein
VRAASSWSHCAGEALVGSVARHTRIASIDVAHEAQSAMRSCSRLLLHHMGLIHSRLHTGSTVAVPVPAAHMGFRRTARSSATWRLSGES